MEETTYIAFDKYLNNELVGEELTDFEERLQNDSEFNEEFEIYKTLEDSLSSKFENEEEETVLRNTLSDLGSKFIKEEEIQKKETKVVPLFNYRKLMVAASIAVLIGFFLFKNGTPVYGDYSNHNSLELIVRGDNNESLLTAEEAFNAKDYNEALKQLTNLTGILPEDIEIQLYIGICNLELNNFDEAGTIFNKISAGDSSFASTGTWYKALSLLKQENLSGCKEVLKTIPESAPEYSDAQELLDKL